MKSPPLSRRDRLRQILADLRMPGALEALDAILQGVDGGTLTAPEAIEQLLAELSDFRLALTLKNGIRALATCFATARSTTALRLPLLGTTAGQLLPKRMLVSRQGLGGWRGTTNRIRQVLNHRSSSEWR
jgi:hypothetical protein